MSTGTTQAGDLTATIGKETANADALTTKICGLSADIATDEADLKAATGIRE